MRFLFIVQGEGRGHMTQAISLATLLRGAGHEIDNVIVGKSERRQLPSFFLEGIGAKVHQVASPNFVTDKDNKSVDLGKSLIHALKRLPTYRRSVGEIDRIVKEDKPDLIINFFDFIGGLFNYFKDPKIPFICVAHQYLISHSSFEFADGKWMDRQSMFLGNWLTSLKASLRLGLSFTELPDEPGLSVVPPLLRKEVLDLSVSEGDYLLVYMLNHGYAADVYQFHDKHPEVNLHCFWDKPGEPKELKVDESLTFHQLDGELFLKYMAGCRGFLTTAGFESVCEAMYLSKPVMMMPVEGHYEQACNALDAEKAGAGIKSDVFDLRKLLSYIPSHRSKSARFRGWCDRSGDIFLEKLTSTGRSN